MSVCVLIIDSFHVMSHAIICLYTKGVDNRGARGLQPPPPPLFWRLSIYRPLSRAFAKETVDQRLYMPWASAYSVHRSGRGTTSAWR